MRTSTAPNLSREEILEFGEFRADLRTRLLLEGDERLPLTPKAFDLLEVLLLRAGELVTKRELLVALWPDTVVEESNLTRLIHVLRKQIGDEPLQHRFIVTVPGLGYRFVAPVSRRQSSGKRREKGFTKLLYAVLLGAGLLAAYLIQR